jgi:ATP-binding cassette subfamily C protein CydC
MFHMAFPAITVGPHGACRRDADRDRRLHIGRALVTRPDVLLIDEPTTGLDADIGAHVLATVRRQLPHAVLVLAMHESPVPMAEQDVLPRLS